MSRAFRIKKPDACLIALIAVGGVLLQTASAADWQNRHGYRWQELKVPGTGRAYLQRLPASATGGLSPWDSPLLGEQLPRDQTTLLGWRKADGSIVVLAGTANYEADQLGGACVREFDMGRNRLAMADVNGDGTLDLFVGGRVEPQEYPEPGVKEVAVDSAGKSIRSR